MIVVTEELFVAREGASERRLNELRGSWPGGSWPGFLSQGNGFFDGEGFSALGIGTFSFGIGILLRSAMELPWSVDERTAVRAGSRPGTSGETLLGLFSSTPSGTLRVE